RAAPVTRCAGGLLHHRFTLTARHAGRRFAFCGTFPRVTPGGRYPPPCPVEPGRSSVRVARQRGRLADSSTTSVYRAVKVTVIRPDLRNTARSTHMTGDSPEARTVVAPVGLAAPIPGTACAPPRTRPGPQPADPPGPDRGARPGTKDAGRGQRRTRCTAHARRRQELECAGGAQRRSAARSG